jgi:flagella basal body P-ring formation protein FlgA
LAPHREKADDLRVTRGRFRVFAVAIALGFIAVGVYRNLHHSAVHDTGPPVSVLVAKRSIAKGTPGNVITRAGLYTVAAIGKGQIQDGALVDPSDLAGKVALTRIPPGAQLTSADFGPSTGG